MTTFTNINKSTAPSWSNRARNSASFTNKVKSGFELTWDTAIMTWNEQTKTWDEVGQAIWINKNKS